VAIRSLFSGCTDYIKTGQIDRLRSLRLFELKIDAYGRKLRALTCERFHFPVHAGSRGKKEDAMIKYRTAHPGGRLFLAATLLVALGSIGSGQEIDPFPSGPIRAEMLRAWTFDSGVEGWTAWHDCAIGTVDGALAIESTGDDPYLGVRIDAAGPVLVVVVRARCATAGQGQIFWATGSSRHMAEERSARFDLVHDWEWREYSIPLHVEGSLAALRVDPGSGRGRVEIDRLAIHRGIRYPLKIASLEAGASRVRVRVDNVVDEPVPFSFAGRSHLIGSRESMTVVQELAGAAPVELVHLRLEPEGFRPIDRCVTVYRSSPGQGCVELETDLLKVLVARDGSGAWIDREGEPVAVLAPIVLDSGSIPPFRISARTARSVEFEGDRIGVSVQVRGDEIEVSIRAERIVEGPVLRALGSLEQGLFAGLEYLGRRERSSSKLDIETEAHSRFTPDPLKVTLPLMACRTEKGVTALTWNDMALKPVFASPDFVDGTGDHRMALRGRSIDATIRCTGAGFEEAISWAVEHRGGLPPLPEAPRDTEEQNALCLDAINGPLRGDGGWGHCAEERWPRHPYADVASTIWRLTGKVPDVGPLVPGGAHIANDAIYFVTGRAGEWLQVQKGAVQTIIASQKRSGGFDYAGAYERGHFERTASGYCALHALRLLEFARITGDGAALKAGVKTLEYMKRFRTPRGAQTWELSLHTPDILASAHLVRAYVRGFELTGDGTFLAAARKWALSGIPFVYLWGRYPIMAYATPPVYGATNYRAPLWIGLPVQWCGLVYAHALTLLEDHDNTLDWNHLARGILIAGQQMQYPSGPLKGCLPDIFELAAQRRAGPSINPCALVSLERVLAGKVDSVDVAIGSGHRVAAPFRVTIIESEAHIAGEAGCTYQVLIDGERIVDVISRGLDIVPLK